MTTPQDHPQEPQRDNGYGGGYSGYHGGGYYPSHGYPEMEPPPQLGTLTGTLLWSGMFIMGLTRLSVRWKGSDNSSDRWMTLHMCKQRCKPPSTHRPAWCMTSLVTSRLILMHKSCKDLSLGDVSVPRYESSHVSFHSQVFQLSCNLSCPLVVSLPLSWLLVSIASIS
jgi:hypothetical protein